MLASRLAGARKPPSMAAKAGRLELDRAGMQMVILVPPAAGLGFRTSLGCGLGLPLAAAPPEPAGLADAAGFAEAEAEAGAGAAALAGAATLAGAALLGEGGAAVPPHADSARTSPNGRPACFIAPPPPARD